MTIFASLSPGPYPCTWTIDIDRRHATPVQVAAFDLARARAALAVAVKAQAPDRHFRGLPESPEVIAAYDAVRAAEGEVARLEREGRQA